MQTTKHIFQPHQLLAITQHVHVRSTRSIHWSSGTQINIWCDA
jgi:hypothetical protein